LRRGRTRTLTDRPGLTDRSGLTDGSGLTVRVLAEGRLAEGRLPGPVAGRAAVRHRGSSGRRLAD
jgi:hypothetical protein